MDRSVVTNLTIQFCRVLTNNELTTKSLIPKFPRLELSARTHRAGFDKLSACHKHWIEDKMQVNDLSLRSPYGQQASDGHRRGVVHSGESGLWIGTQNILLRRDADGRSSNGSMSSHRSTERERGRECDKPDTVRDEGREWERWGREIGREG